LEEQTSVDPFLFDDEGEGTSLRDLIDGLGHFVAFLLFGQIQLTIAYAFAKHDHVFRECLFIRISPSI
jgi:hypothetical protein